jgi:hypothetical protein
VLANPQSVAPVKYTAVRKQLFNGFWYACKISQPCIVPKRQTSPPQVLRPYDSPHSVVLVLAAILCD